MFVSSCNLQLNSSVVFIISRGEKEAKQPTTKMPHAIAKINDKTIAETDNYEFVEGNVYVSLERSFLHISY